MRLANTCAVLLELTRSKPETTRPFQCPPNLCLKKTHLIFISGFNSSSGGCSKSLSPIIPNCRRRISWKLVLSVNKKAPVVCHGGGFCTSKVGRHSRAAIKQAEQAENRDFRQIRSGMQSVWASPQQGARAVRRCGAALVELEKWVTEAAKYVELLLHQKVLV